MPTSSSVNQRFLILLLLVKGVELTSTATATQLLTATAYCSPSSSSAKENRWGGPSRRLWSTASAESRRPAIKITDGVVIADQPASSRDRAAICMRRASRSRCRKRATRAGSLSNTTAVIPPCHCRASSRNCRPRSSHVKQSPDRTIRRTSESPLVAGRNAAATETTVSTTTAVESPAAKAPRAPRLHPAREAAARLSSNTSIRRVSLIAWIPQQRVAAAETCCYYPTQWLTSHHPRKSR